MSLAKFLKGLVGALQKENPEERTAALGQLEIPEDANPTPPPAAGNTPPAASPTGINLKGNETPSELVEIIKAQNEVIKNISTDVAAMKKSQEEQSAALSNQAKKQLEAKVSEALEKAKREGRIAPKDEKTLGFWKAQLENNFDGAIEVLNTLPGKSKSEPAVPQQGNAVPPTGTASPVNALDSFRKAAADAFATSAANN